MQGSRSRKTSTHKKTPALPGAEVLVNEINYQEENVMSNSSTVVDMRKFVEARNGEAFTTTQNVAEAFGKQHQHVTQKIEALECSVQFLTSNFSLVGFEHRGNSYKSFEMTKDGFMFLVMGFTGKKAAAIKEGYIAAFNEMAMLLGRSAQDLVGEVVAKALGKEGALILSSVMRCRVAKLDADNQRSATAKLASALHARFSVPRIELIPASQLESACNFIAAYAIEGEYLGKETPAIQRPLNIHYPVGALAVRREGMMTIRNSEQAWLDVTLHDLRDIHGQGTPLESLLGELSKAGYEVEGAWWELRTYRNKMHEIASFARGLNRVIEDPHRYAIKPRNAA